MKMKILVVGAGPSGLAALKEMREAGLDAIAVDGRSQIGGVFSLDSNVTFEHLYLTINNMFMSFSDFPPTDSIKYWSKDEYYQYLAQYVEQFKLKDHIQLRTTVLKAKLNCKSQKWEVALSTKIEPNDHHSKTTIQEEEFDYLIVATGSNSIPKIPSSILEAGFNGQIMHSSQFHSADQVAGKKVLVIGRGESSTDVACFATDVAESVTIYSRRYPNLAPRFLQDFLYSDEYDERKRLQDQSELLRPNHYLDIVTTSPVVRNLPLGVWGFMLNGLLADLRRKYPGKSQKVLSEIALELFKKDFYSSDTFDVPNKTEMLADFAALGKLDILVAKSMEFQKGTNKVSFQNPAYYKQDFITDEMNAGIELEVDVIVACTGFDLQFDWLLITSTGCDDDDIHTESVNADPRTWFKHCLPAGLGHKLAFLGFARPHSGGIPACSEMLARYIAQILVGATSLPSNYAEIAIFEGNRERECYHETPHYSTIVDYYAFMMSVARLIGCPPQPPSLWSPTEVIKHWTLPLWPCFFRTRGPGAKPEVFNAVLKRFGPYDALAPQPLLAVELICTFLTPLLNLMSFIWDIVLFDRCGADSIRRNNRTYKAKTSALPSFYKWRMSKCSFMYANSLCLESFCMIPAQIMAGLLILLHILGLGLLEGERSSAKNVGKVKVE